MEDRCVVCGDVVPEGTWVCPSCKLAGGNAPCMTCTDKKMDCHVYCSRYLEYFKAKERAREFKRRKDDENSYFIKKSLKRKCIARKDEYTRGRE